MMRFLQPIHDNVFALYRNGEGVITTNPDNVLCLLNHDWLLVYPCADLDSAARHLASMNLKTTIRFIGGGLVEEIDGTFQVVHYFEPIETHKHDVSILRKRPSTQRNIEIVLAYWPLNNPPFVTWQRNINRPDEFYRGNYFERYDDAVENWTNR